VTDVLLATCRELASGEPGHEALDAELDRLGLDHRWARWDDPEVDWGAARLVAVRSTWDYAARVPEFLAWTRRVESRTPLLNGADTMAWNVDKAYLLDVPGAVPTLVAESVEELAAAVLELGTAVVKPRIGNGGAGMLVTDDPADPRLGRPVAGHPELPVLGGPWICQPLVESVRTTGETSVFVLDGAAVARVDKLPAAGEIRVHEHFGGRSAPAPLTEDAAACATTAVGAVATRLGRPVDYARVDLLRGDDDGWLVGEIELVEPGLYLDVMPENAVPFAGLVGRRLAG
jgi:glutathione synthase/RimK-type ligase-like ATP-grasp enzyme